MREGTVRKESKLNSKVDLALKTTRKSKSRYYCRIEPHVL